MNKSVLTKDPGGKKLQVVREFDAPVAEVWEAWTTPELLDQWWAPRPWKAETKTMDFREGGHWLYSMVGPEGERHYCRADYQSITPQQRYTAMDAFTDENGTPTPGFPRMQWNCSFVTSGSGTKVTAEITFNSAEELQKIIEMGFEQGFAMAHGNLDELLANKK